jgi:glycosyltransferase involved in cell wall biosynthesis
MPAVSLVIRALNEEEHIGRLLRDARNQTVPPDEIVLVDSGSTDRTVEIATDAGARIVSIEPADFSFGRALNVGCAAATGELLVFASAHVYPVEHAWIERLLSPFDHAQVGLSYGGQTGDERTQFSESRVLRAWFPPRSDLDQRHPFCNNANCAIRRELWTEFPYDEDLTGLEDLDWANRIHATGYHIAYVADAVVVHVHEETFDQTRNRYEREAAAHRRIFGDQTMSPLEAAAMFGANVLGDYAAAVVERKMVGNLLSIPKFRLAQFWGAYRGFRREAEVTTDLKRRFYYPGGIQARSSRGAGSGA